MIDKSKTKPKKKESINISIDSDVLRQVNKHRKYIPLSVYINNILTQRMKFIKIQRKNAIKVWDDKLRRRRKK